MGKNGIEDKSRAGSGRARNRWQIHTFEYFYHTGFLKPSQYLIHDRDTKYSDAFKQIIDDVGIKRLPLPPRSPWLNGYAERWVKSVKDEVLSQVILFGEGSLRHVLSEYVEHYHTERCHQGLGNVIPFPNSQPNNDREGPIECRERLGGLLKYYHRKAA